MARAGDATLAVMAELPRKSSDIPSPIPGTPLRLFQLMLSKGPGGVETVFEKLSVALHERGVAQRLIVEPVGGLSGRLSATGCRVLPIRFGGLFELMAQWRLHRELRQFQPHVVMGWLSRAARRLPRGEFATVGRPGGYYKAKYYDRCNHMVVTTPLIRDHFVRQGRDAASLTIIPNFTDLQPPAASRDTMRQLLGIEPDTKVALALGRLHPVKGLDVLLNALVEVPEMLLLLAGDGPLRAELEAQARQLGVLGRVRFLGWRLDTANLLQASDLCVFPSRTETFGTVVLESWACGVPIIASRADGPASLIDDGENGLLVAIEDVKGLAAAMRRMMTDPALRERCVTTGQQKFRAGFSRDRIVGQYLELFQTLAERGPTPRATAPGGGS
jgi:glycosyltransferase involved in cell wall biosynthesis